MVLSQEVNDVTLSEPKSIEANISLDQNSRDGDLDGFNNLSAVHKLDIMSSKQYNRLIVVNFLLILYTFGHVSVLFLCCQTVWKGERSSRRRSYLSNLQSFTCIFDHVVHRRFSW